MRTRFISGLPLAAVLLSIIAIPSWASTQPYGPNAPADPAMGAPGTATMHADAASSDSTPLPGPGAQSVSVKKVGLKSACPSILTGTDDMPVAVCTKISNRTPYVHLLDPSTGESLVSKKLVRSKSSDLAGGIYSYLDPKNRLVLVNAAGYLLRIAHKQSPSGKWRLIVVRKHQIGYSNVVGIVPDYKGRVWFATATGNSPAAGAVVGYFNPKNRRTVTRSLPAGEQVANSISASPVGVAIASTYGQYMFRAAPKNRIVQLWRKPYDRGPARKPGQLSWGTGATPTFFGPKTGAEFLTITDNAAPQENLLVYRAKTGRLVCSVPILGTDNSGTENSPIGSGRNVFIASTYGYPYPKSATTGPSSPATAAFVGGMQRIKVKRGGKGCRSVWSNEVRSTAVPRLSLADGLIYTVSLTSNGRYKYTTIDPKNGVVQSSAKIGRARFNTLQMVGTIASDQVLYQGTITGLVRVTPRGPTTTPGAAQKISVKVKAVKKRSKLQVDVNPNKASKNYKFKIQKKVRGKWRTVRVTYTKGRFDKRTVNLRKGEYRIKVPKQHGVKATTSKAVRLKR